MAGKLRTGLLTSSIKSSNDSGTLYSGPKAFKAAGIAAIAASPGNGITPRKYIKLLHNCIITLEPHRQKLPVEALRAVKELDAAVKAAAHTHSATAAGKLHYYLMEDLQLQQLQTAATELCGYVSSLVKLSTYQALDFQADVNDVASKLSNSKCTLPAHQLQLIEEFRSLASRQDPTLEISDGLQKSAEQVVRKVIAEVHGPFFNGEILNKELTHLEKTATWLDPLSQRLEAASVKLLASSLMQQDGDDHADDDVDSLAPGQGIDPFSVPSFASLMRMVDPVTPRQGSPLKQLTIHLSGEGSSPASSPSAGLHSPLQHMQQLQAALSNEATPAGPPNSIQQPGAAAPVSVVGTRLGPFQSSSRLAGQGLATETSTATTGITVAVARAAVTAAATAAEIADAAATAAAQRGDDCGSMSTMYSIAGPNAAAAAWAASAAAAAVGAGGGGSSSSAVHQQCSSPPDSQVAQPGTGVAADSAGGAAAPNSADAVADADLEAAAASRQLLDEFIESSSSLGTRDSKRACVFHAQMRLPPEGVQRLAGFLASTARVRGLSLAHNWIGPEGMQLLCNAMRVNKSVRILELQDNKLGDAGAIALAQLMLEGSKLTTLQLSSNQIGDQGMVALAAAIAKMRSFEKLSVYNNNIGSVGCQALAAAVAANSTLKVVEFLPGNSAQSKDVKALARAIKQNRKFNICNLFGKHRAPS